MGDVARDDRSQRFIEAFAEEAEKRLKVSGDFVLEQYINIDEDTDYVRQFVLIEDVAHRQHLFMSPAVLFSPDLDDNEAMFDDVYDNLADQEADPDEERERLWTMLHKAGLLFEE